MARAALLPRRHPRQTSRRERALGLCLLLLAAGTLGLFLVAGARPGPAGLPAPAALPEARLPLTAPGGWPRGELERYGPDTLFEKINGKAEAYLAYDVAGLEFASYSDPARVESFTDVYLYDMGRPLHAYGIYRSQRSGGEAPAALGDEACAPGRALFVRKGRFYLELLASDAAARKQAHALAAAVVDALPPGKEPVTDPPWFPRSNLRIVRYDRRNCLMVEALEDAFLAVYLDGSKAVVARCEDEGAARQALRAARENFDFLGEPARFEVVGRRVVGVLGVLDDARLAVIVKRLKHE